VCEVFQEKLASVCVAAVLPYVVPLQDARSRCAASRRLCGGVVCRGCWLLVTRAPARRLCVLDPAVSARARSRELVSLDDLFLAVMG
jgi:hypothetical protein